MEDVNLEITPQIFYSLYDLYNSNTKSFTKSEFCDIIGIEDTNTKTYQKVIKILKDLSLIKVSEWLSNKIILDLDRNGLGDFLYKSSLHQKADEFIHNYVLGAVT